MLITFMRQSQNCCCLNFKTFFRFVLTLTLYEEWNKSCFLLNFIQVYLSTWANEACIVFWFCHILGAWLTFNLRNCSVLLFSGMIKKKKINFSIACLIHFHKLQVFLKGLGVYNTFQISIHFGLAQEVVAEFTPAKETYRDIWHTNVE